MSWFNRLSASYAFSTTYAALLSKHHRFIANALPTPFPRRDAGKMTKEGSVSIANALLTPFPQVAFANTLIVESVSIANASTPFHLGKVDMIE